MKILAVDLGSVYATAWHASAGDDVNAAAQLVMDRVRRMAGNYDRVAICRDSKTNWRKNLFDGYKGDRFEKPEGFYHQLDAATDRLRADGFTVLDAEGFEADDIIGTLCAWATESQVDIHTADKDLLQCLRDSPPENAVRIITNTGEERDVEWLAENMGGLLPMQMPCFLALTGDKSDSLPGVHGCGVKTAALLLDRFDSLDEVLRVAREEVTALHALPGVGPALTSALFASVDRTPSLYLVRKLATVRTDAPINCAALLEEPRPTVTRHEEPMEDYLDNSAEEQAADQIPEPAASPPPASEPRMTTQDAPRAVDDLQWSTPCDQVAQALASAQAAMVKVSKAHKAEVKTSKGPGYSYTYASLADVQAATRPLAENGVAIIQLPGAQNLKTVLMHRSGQWIQCTTPLFIRGGGPQEYGSAVTYARRYALASLCNIAVDDDDDGAAAQQQYHQRRRGA
ncbi:MAG: hypothetical protein GVY18_03545 [Bacteroidetes bacterium]|jgi:DNA polymerase-1|nr:hypothetical protein [Bacteroidota bacterium]